MKTALILFAIILLSSLPKLASAKTEFCPATLRIEPVRPAASSAPSRLFGFQLEALGPRSLDATIAFDTSAGWFTVATPPVLLQERIRHLYWANTMVTDDQWVSPPMYVHFSQAVWINHAWVSRAMTAGDTFGWSDKAAVSCEPYSDQITAEVRSSYYEKVDVEDRLNEAPGNGSHILEARPSPPLESATCKHPFQDAQTLNLVPVQYTGILDAEGVNAITSVEIALAADSSIRDAWIWRSSGNKEYDDAVLAAAKHSTYRAAQAYCRPVPGQYLFTAPLRDD